MGRLRVLFVDDEEELVEAVVERLELRDIEACGATDGVEALQRLEEQTFDVAILDVRMPGLGGLDLLRRIKRTHPAIGIILLSGHGSTEDVEEGLRLGAVAYLQKPVDLKQLVDLIGTAARQADDRTDDE